MDHTTPPPPATPPETPESRLAGIHVLIADEDYRIAVLVRKILESLGFKVIRIARDGTQALQLLKSERFDMLITDWRMTPMDGVSLVKHLRTQDDSPNRFIPIIMLTGNADREHVQQARDIGVTEFVVKPFSAKTLVERIRLLIENPRSFIMSKRFTGPDRRRRDSGGAPDGTDRRNRN
jgi:DNA-binding response OmpR family regulator